MAVLNRIGVLVAALMACGLTMNGAEAARCGNNSGGFGKWKAEFAKEAKANGISGKALSALAGTKYSTTTIRADRGQKSFRLSLNAFMQKRGGQAIAQRGRSMKSQNAKLFASIEKRYGVPAGPLVAIWGMETASAGSWAVPTSCRPWRRSPMTAAGASSSPATSTPPSTRPERRAQPRGGRRGPWRDRADAIPAGQRPQIRHRRRWKRSRRPHQVEGRCARLDREFPEGAWLAGGRRIPARTGQFRGAPGVERSRRLSAGDRHHRRQDRRLTEAPARRPVTIDRAATAAIRTLIPLALKSPRNCGFVTDEWCEGSCGKRPGDEIRKNSDFAMT